MELEIVSGSLVRRASKEHIGSLFDGIDLCAFEFLNSRQRRPWTGVFYYISRQVLVSLRIVSNVMRIISGVIIFKLVRILAANYI